MKKYNCPYCGYRGSREDLISHIEEEHDEMIPENFTAARVVFNLVNKKDHGVCVVCKRETEWNENASKYDRMCGRKACSDALRKIAVTNHIKVYNKPTLLGDDEHQEKMLANRGISGKYRFTDGGYVVYTGSYEKKALEFIDKVLGFKSWDILCPGPVFEYEYEGKTHKWITDMLLIPFNLIIEVKDGGSNPNNRTMTSYREKQVAKEQMITSLGKFNYLRLTDNNFAQLLGTIAELKAQMIDDSEDNKKVVININEEVEALNEESSKDITKFKAMILKKVNANSKFKNFIKGKSKDDIKKINDKIYNSSAKILREVARLTFNTKHLSEKLFWAVAIGYVLSMFGIIASSAIMFGTAIGVDYAVDARYNKKNESTELESEIIDEMSISVPLNKDHIQKGNKSLFSFKKVSITDNDINKYKQDMKSLSHIRTEDGYKGTIFLDKNNPVCYVNVNSNNGMIQALEISKDYQGYGLSSQLLKYAVSTLKATSLTVNKKNEVAINVYKKQGFKQVKATDNMITMSIDESMGLAGIGGMPAPSNQFITQFGPRSTFSDDTVEGYAIHNDIITDKILLVDKNGNLAVKESSFLEGRKIRIFKYIGENVDEYYKILKSAKKNKKAYREYLYEALTGKRLLSDDQIICDECFEEISPVKIFAEYNSAAQTIVDQYKEIIGEEIVRFPLMNEKSISEASKITTGNIHINIFENMNGYFAENAITRQRTAYYKDIKDIQIEVIL
jgi:GNAT superfamily N-acetyltransferase